MDTVIPLRKDIGEPMALVRTKQGAVLILTKRKEDQGPFFYLSNDASAYPIIRFENPPELCGVTEPNDFEELKTLQTKLQDQFIQALIAACNEEGISIIYCVGIDNAKAKVYAERLKTAGIVLQEF